MPKINKMLLGCLILDIYACYCRCAEVIESSNFSHSIFNSTTYDNECSLNASSEVSVDCQLFEYDTDLFTATVVSKVWYTLYSVICPLQFIKYIYTLKDISIT